MHFHFAKNIHNLSFDKAKYGFCAEYLLYTRHHAKCGLPQIGFTISLSGKYYHNPHFTDEESEIWKSHVTCSIFQVVDSELGGYISDWTMPAFSHHTTLPAPMGVPKSLITGNLKVGCFPRHSIHGGIHAEDLSGIWDTTSCFPLDLHLLATAARAAAALGVVLRAHEMKGPLGMKLVKPGASCPLPHFPPKSQFPTIIILHEKDPHCRGNFWKVILAGFLRAAMSQQKATNLFF